MIDESPVADLPEPNWTLGVIVLLAVLLWYFLTFCAQKAT